MAPVLEFESGMTDTAPAPLLLLLHVFNMAMKFICSITNDKKSEEFQTDDHFDAFRLQEMTMEEKRRALRAAAEAGNILVVQQLLRADTYHSASDREGYTPLHWAAARGHLDVVRILIESGAHLEERGGRKFLFTPLHMASVIMAPVLEFESGMTDTAPAPLLLLLHVFNMAMKFICSITNDKKSEEFQTDDHFDAFRLQEMTMEEKRRALRAAAEAGNILVVQQLLRADTYHSASDREGYTPLHWAAARGHLDVVRILIESGAHLEERGGRKFLFTPLHMASGEGHLEICRLLLDKGARVKALDRYRDTPLHWAAWFGHLPVVQLLVERGAFVGAKNTDGHTPEDMASLRRQHQITEWLQKQ